MLRKQFMHNSAITNNKNFSKIQNIYDHSCIIYLLSVSNKNNENTMNQNDNIILANELINKILDDINFENDNYSKL